MRAHVAVIVGAGDAIGSAITRKFAAPRAYSLRATPQR